MRIERFEDIMAWKKAKQLVLLVYKETSDCSDFGFCRQIQRASVSVMNNIAEGFERQGNNELKRFLYISKGSSGEVRSMLYLAKELGYIQGKSFDEAYALSGEISRMLSGLIKKL